MPRQLVRTLQITLATVLVAATAVAQPPVAVPAAPSAALPPQPPVAAPAQPTHVDSGYGLNRSYLEAGTVVPEVPHDALAVPFGEEHYWFHDGVWYRQDAATFVVVAAPIGIVVPLLPSAFVTLSAAGVPYYYANGTYYTYVDNLQGYEVVAAPTGIERAPGASPVAVTAPTPIGSYPQYIYPKNGQSADQQATDRYECHRWATGQSGFNPILTTGGVAPAEADIKRADYSRAMSACLEARGYSVR